MEREVEFTCELFILVHFQELFHYMMELEKAYSPPYPLAFTPSLTSGFLNFPFTSSLPFFLLPSHTSCLPFPSTAPLSRLLVLNSALPLQSQQPLFIPNFLFSCSPFLCFISSVMFHIQGKKQILRSLQVSNKFPLLTKNP